MVAIAAYPCVCVFKKPCRVIWFKEIRRLSVLSFTPLLLPLSVLIFHIRAIERSCVSAITKRYRPCITYLDDEV
jgi:hypothetical protein